MNPRFEGSLDIAIKSGVDLPDLLLEIMNGDEIPAGIPYRTGVHYRWLFRLDFRYFLNKPYGLFKFIAETLDPKVHGEITIDDPWVIRAFWKRPLRELVQYLREIG